jgi:hypothetical protein
LGVVWTLAQEAGPQTVRAVVVAPSGENASNEYRFEKIFEAWKPTRWTFEFDVEADEEGLSWLLVEVGLDSQAKFPLGVRWAPDSARARRRAHPE